MSAGAGAGAASEKEIVLATTRTLVEVFGFPKEAASAALKAIGDKSDVDMAIGWILDHTDCEDKGGPVRTVECPHADCHTEKTLINPEKIIAFKPVKCCEGGNDSCKTSGEVWICLHCGERRCSRYVKSHNLKHYQESVAALEKTTTIAEAEKAQGHHIAMSLSDLSIWCYICNKYVFHESFKPLVLRMQSLKFAASTPSVEKASTDSDTASAASSASSAQSLTDIQAHGSQGVGKNWDQPELARFCDTLARPGYQSMPAHEYLDTPRTLRLKAKALAKLLTSSKNAIVYSGAGLSTASGIPDYGTKAGDSSLAKSSAAAKKSSGKKKSSLKARPTYSHHVLVSLFNSNILKYWVNQNHDGLPQKAGLPLKFLNEIHGAWHDPTNPVVPMSGNLREDLIDKLVEWEQKTDLVLALGSTLCGMNADRLVESASKRAKARKGFGSVIISLQRTQHDENCSLRVFSKLDDFFQILAEEMNLEVGVDDPEKFELAPPGQEVFLDLPYDPKTGKKDPKKKVKLDLREGKKVRLVNLPDWDEKRIGSNIAESLGRSDDGHFLFAVSNGSVIKVLGSWWLREAMSGEIDCLPVLQA